MSNSKKTVSKSTTTDNKPFIRRDATGHLQPQYESELLEASRENRANEGNEKAFIRRARSGEELAEEMGEAFVESAVSGEETQTERHEQPTPEEHGGPFVLSNAAAEFASGTDASNIVGATREPFPKTSKAGP